MQRPRHQLRGPGELLRLNHEPMKLSVVVVNWNGRELLHSCLGTLAVQTHDALEIIVFDNGSSDGSMEMVEREFPAVKRIVADENLGFAEGCNRGIEQSEGEWVCMLNNDTEADRDWAKELAMAAASVPLSCGMLQSRMLFMHRPTINSTGIELQKNGGGCDRGEGEPHDARQEADEIFCPTAGAAAYRRAMLESIRLRDGYFDRRHFLYFEDTDLGWRARLCGWTARYVPSSIVRHHYHATSDRHGRDFLRSLAATNRVRMLLKNASWPFIVRSSPTSVTELAALGWRSGPKAVKSYADAVVSSLRTRAEVDGMMRLDRRDVERRWAR